MSYTPDDTAVTTERIQLLQRVPAFGGISASVLGFILDNADEVVLPAGAFLFKEAEIADGAYIIETGKIRLLRQYRKCNYLLATLGHGACIGHQALIGIFPRAASAQAMTNCTLIKLTLNILAEVRNKDADQYSMMLMNMARELARRLKDADYLLLKTLADNNLRNSV